MFDKFESIILQFTLCLSLFSMNSCLNITEMSVPSIVWAPEKAMLTCVKQDDTENDTFVNIHWFKLVGHQWKLVKIYAPPAPLRAGSRTLKAEEGESDETPKEDTPQETPTEPATEAPATNEKPEDKPEETKEEKSNENIENKSTKSEKEEEKEQVLYELPGLDLSIEDSNIQFTATSLSSAGSYKCVVKSSKEIKEEMREMKVFYKPEEGSKPELTLIKVQDNHINIKCKAPASYPVTALNFFINYELAPHGEVHRLPAIATKNTTYGPTEELLINVEELRFRATKHNVLNGDISIACIATFAELHNSFDQLNIKFDGSLYSPNCLTTPFIILIVIAVIIVVIVIVVIVWLYLRKKKLNSLNKVAELFNKQSKTITVLVDNNVNDLKVE